jgi:hypothetical protein
MASQLQEAIYLFEMKGEVDESIRLLEKISRQGDADDKESAFFYLGKIYDLASNKDRLNRLVNNSKNIKSPGVIKKIERQIRNIENSLS